MRSRLASLGDRAAKIPALIEAWQRSRALGSAKRSAIPPHAGAATNVAAVHAPPRGGRASFSGRAAPASPAAAQFPESSSHPPQSTPSTPREGEGDPAPPGDRSPPLTWAAYGKMLELWLRWPRLARWAEARAAAHAAATAGGDAPPLGLADVPFRYAPDRAVRLNAVLEHYARGAFTAAEASTASGIDAALFRAVARQYRDERDAFLGAARRRVDEAAAAAARGAEQGTPTGASQRALDEAAPALAAAVAETQRRTMVWLRDRDEGREGRDGGGEGRDWGGGTTGPPRGDGNAGGGRCRGQEAQSRRVAELFLLQFSPDEAARVALSAALAAVQGLDGSAGASRGVGLSGRGRDGGRRAAGRANPSGGDVDLFAVPLEGSAPVNRLVASIGAALSGRLALARAEGAAEPGGGLPADQRRALDLVARYGPPWLLERHLAAMPGFATPEGALASRTAAALLLDLALLHCHVLPFWEERGPMDENAPRAPSPLPPETVPLFHHVMHRPLGARGDPRTVGFLVLHPGLAAWLRVRPAETTRDVRPPRPMLVPPVPWQGMFEGGYLHLQHAVIKPARTGGAQLLQAAHRGLDASVLRRGYHGPSALATHPLLASTLDRHPSLREDALVDTARRLAATRLRRGTRGDGDEDLDTLVAEAEAELRRLRDAAAASDPASPRSRAWFYPARAGELLPLSERPPDPAPALQALSCLGAAPWKVNQVVLSAVEACLEVGGGGIGQVPPTCDAAFAEASRKRHLAPRPDGAPAPHAAALAAGRPEPLRRAVERDLANLRSERASFQLASRRPSIRGFYPSVQTVPLSAPRSIQTVPPCHPGCNIAPSLPPPSLPPILPPSLLPSVPPSLRPRPLVPPLPPGPRHRP